MLRIFLVAAAFAGFVAGFVAVAIGLANWASTPSSLPLPDVAVDFRGIAVGMSFTEIENSHPGACVPADVRKLKCDLDDRIVVTVDGAQGERNDLIAVGLRAIVPDPIGFSADEHKARKSPIQRLVLQKWPQMNGQFHARLNDFGAHIETTKDGLGIVDIDAGAEPSVGASFIEISAGEFRTNLEWPEIEKTKRF